MSSLPPANEGPSSLRVLVVDDQRSNLLALQTVLEPLEAQVLLAESGEAALRLLLDQDVALILLDVRMPGVDGLEVARIIRSRPRTRETPIIFVTAYRDEKEMFVAYELGAVDFLFKPIEPIVLQAKAAVFIDLARQRERLQAHERREHAAALERERQSWQIAQLADLDRRKDEFLAVLGHELRSPLGALTTALDLLGQIGARASATDAAMERARALMQRQVAHLTRLVDDVFDVARINAGKVELQLEETCVQDVVAQAVSISRPQIDAGHHELLVEVPADRLEIRCDLVRVAQVLSNLLNNAARYTPQGGKISLRCSPAAGGVELVVEDNGEGIEPAALARVFEPFTQGANGASQGLGLGLLIVQRLVALHGGKVSLESDGVGRGTRAVVWLPSDGVSAPGD